MLGFCPLISAFDRSGKFGRSRRKDLGPSLCKDVCPFSCLNCSLGNGRWAAWRSGYSRRSSGFRVKLSSGEWSSAVSVFWGRKAMHNNDNWERAVLPVPPSFQWLQLYSTQAHGLLLKHKSVIGWHKIKPSQTWALSSPRLLNHSSLVVSTYTWTQATDLNLETRGSEVTPGKSNCTTLNMSLKMLKGILLINRLSSLCSKVQQKHWLLRPCWNLWY